MKWISGEQRLMERFYVDPDTGCWVWTGALNYYGYAVMTVLRKVRLMHRFSYEMHRGPIPKGLVLDHLCRNKKCVNPAHLEAVTHRVNLQRSAPATKTHCKRGHLLRDRQTNGDRYCKRCQTDLQRERYHRIRAQMA